MGENLNTVALKRFIERYIENRQLAKVTQGTIVSITPLQVRLEDNLVIDGEVISLTWTDKLGPHMLNKKVTMIRQDGGGHYHMLYTNADTAGNGNNAKDGTKAIVQPSASIFDASRQAGASSVSTEGWNEAWVNAFKMNAADPPYVNGEYIDNFLRKYYSDSPLIGHGATIKEMADYFGVAVGAFMGQVAKETVFGRSSCGGRYNFGCIMWTSGSPFPKKWAGDRDWIDPPTIRSGIIAWFKLVRYNYIETGQAVYRDFLNKYSPDFENNQATFKNLFWGVLKAFGYDTADTKTKTNYSNKNDNPLTLTVPSGANTHNNLVVHVSNAWLNTTQMASNARYIWIVLKNLGWSEQAIAGLLGNLQVESSLNPGIWEGLVEGNTSRGFGLVQYTPASAFINWAKSQSLDSKSMDVQLNAIDKDALKHWIPTSSYNLTYDQFKKSTNTPEWLAQAFLRNFERPANQNQPARSTHARNWYNQLSGTNATDSPASVKLETMLKWFYDRLGKVSYSMGARMGPSSYDCSSAVFFALIHAGYVSKGTWPGTTETLFQYAAQGKLLTQITRAQVKRGDIFVAGVPGASMYGNGHTGVAINENQIIHCTYSKNGIAITPIAGWTGGPPVRWYRIKE